MSLKEIEWLPGFVRNYEPSRSDVVWFLVLFVATVAVSILAVFLVVIRLPPNYFQDPRPRTLFEDRHPALRWGFKIVKNVVGLVVLAAGIVFLIGPGQGVLTVLIGIMLLDFPGKRRLEQKLVARPRIFQGLNWCRQRWGKPPLLPPCPPECGPGTAATMHADDSRG